MNASEKRIESRLIYRYFTVPTALVFVLLGSLVAAFGFNLLAEYHNGIPWREPKVVDPGSPAAHGRTAQRRDRAFRRQGSLAVGR